MATAITTSYSVRSNFRGSRKANIFLWILQALLAALFLFAGSMKLMMPAAALEQQAHMSAAFLRFIGACELLGALGLLLPGLTRIRPSLSSLAATGLVIIMAGAVLITAATSGAAMAVMPFAVGVLAAIVAGGRRYIAPHPYRAHCARG